MPKPKLSDFLQNLDAATPTVYVQYKGIFDMEDLYQSIADFFRQKKFKFYEKQQRLRRPGPFGPEIFHHFEGIREVEEYYQWKLVIKIETYDMHTVEVVQKDGTKKKMDKGRIWIQLSGIVETDYDKVWEQTAFLAKLKSFYNKYVIRKNLEGVWWDELYYNIVLKLHSLIKERLKMASEGYEHRHFSRVH
ncbi:MAG TPA: hypothetical protein VI564_01970 [Candidatus Nanoarchaeia archaeon]|nr:hypothetical protein [Candidatus Nanoarchaeia archaeon]